MGSPGVREDENVVVESFEEAANTTTEHHEDDAVHRFRCIAVPLLHDVRDECAKRHGEPGMLDVVGMHSNLLVRRLEI